MCIVIEFKSIFCYLEIFLFVIVSFEVGGYSGYISVRREKYVWCMWVVYEFYIINLVGKSW